MTILGISDGSCLLAYDILLDCSSMFCLVLWLRVVVCNLL
jgi:hypothetical protein